MKFLVSGVIMTLLGTGIAAPYGTVQISLWTPEIGIDSVWGKEFWIAPTDPVDKNQLSQDVAFDIVTRIEQKNLPPLSGHLNLLLNVFVKEGIDFWWEEEVVNKADVKIDPYIITFQSIGNHYKKEVHVHHEEMLLLDMYTYYAQPYVDEEE